MDIEFAAMATSELNWPLVIRETHGDTNKCQKTVASSGYYTQQLHLGHHEEARLWLWHVYVHERPSCRAIRRKLAAAARSALCLARQYNGLTAIHD